MRFELPCVYIVFYDFFLKASMGDSRWKAICLEATSKSEPFSTVQDEAFAMILLKNNYFAWLWEAKLKLKKLLVTDYDTEALLRNKSHVGEDIVAVELNLEPNEEENEEEDETANDDSNSTSYDNIMVQQGNQLFRDLKKRTDDALKKARRLARANDKYKEVKKLYEEEMKHLEEYGTTGTNSGKEGVPEEDDEEQEEMRQRTKKRKVLKSFREYTNPLGEEGRFKGWSHRATDDMVRLSDILEGEMETIKAKRFRAAYRINYESKFRNEKKKRANQESVIENYERTVWRLPVVAGLEVEL